MKITLPDEMQTRVFNTKEDWKTYMLQFLPFSGHYNPQPYDEAPVSFPCIMIYNDRNIIYNSNKNDEFMNFFAYEWES